MTRLVKLKNGPRPSDPKISAFFGRDTLRLQNRARKRPRFRVRFRNRFWSRFQSLICVSFLRTRNFWDPLDYCRFERSLLGIVFELVFEHKNEYVFKASFAPFFGVVFWRTKVALPKKAEIFGSLGLGPFFSSTNLVSSH